MCEKNYKYQFYEKELSETIDERYLFISNYLNSNIKISLFSFPTDHIIE